jgi:hypothetical protein
MARNHNRGQGSSSTVAPAGGGGRGRGGGQIGHNNDRKVLCLQLCVHSAVRPVTKKYMNILQILYDLLSYVRKQLWSINSENLIMCSLSISRVLE